MVKIIGVGPAPGYITEIAKNLITKAKNVYGSKRAIDLAKHYIKGNIHVIKDFKNFNPEDLSKDSIILSTGDPMVSGLGSMYSEYEVEIIPGVSSVQLALARLKIDLCETIVFDFHSRIKSIDEIISALKLNRKVLILGSKRIDLRSLIRVAKDFGKNVYVLENLGYSNERIFKPIYTSKIESNLVIVAII